MKFVALALALLLAVACQGASLQADAPSQLAHIRSVIDVYMNQVKESAKKALDQLDDTEYKALKEKMSQHLEDMHTQVKTMQAHVSPITDNVVKTLADATAGLRTAIEADIETLKADLEPKGVALKDVLEKHFAEYHAKLEPVVTEHYAKHTAEVDALKAKLEPLIADLQTKVTTNIEETKAAMMPIVESVQTKISERLEEMKNLAKPYVDEYKNHMKQAYDQAKSFNTQDLTGLKDKITPIAEEIKGNLQQIAEIVMASFQS